MAIPKSRSYVFGDGDDNGYVPGMKKYKGALPSGSRNVGQYLYWAAKSGQKVKVFFIKYDSNSGFKENFVATLDNYKKHAKELKDKGFYVDDPKIGDYSFYYLKHEDQKDIEDIDLYFTYRNYYAKIEVLDKKGKSLDEAIRIAKIVKSRIV